MKKEILTLALLGLLAGCSSQPSLHYYSLDADSQQPVTAPTQPQHQLVLRPVVLASQLDRISLVYQLEGQELHFTEYHRWAGSLDDQLNQVTMNGLSARLPGWVVRQDGARHVALALAPDLERAGDAVRCLHPVGVARVHAAAAANARQPADRAGLRAG